MEFKDDDIALKDIVGFIIDIKRRVFNKIKKIILEPSGEFSLRWTIYYAIIIL